MARSVNGSTDRITLVNPDGLTVAGPWTFGIMVEPLGTGGVVKVGPNDGTDGTRGVLLLIKSPSGAPQLRSAGGLVDSSTALSPGWNRITVTKAGTGNGLGSVGIGGAQVGATSINAPPALVAGDAINISMGQSDIGVGALPGSVARFFWLQGTALSHAAANAIFDDFDAAVATYGSALSVLNYIEGAVAPEPDFRTPGTNSLAITGTTQVADPIGIPSGDTDPPTLTNATASATGSTTASGSVDTDEGNGTLYRIASEVNSAPDVTQIQAGQDGTGVAAAASGSQAVSAPGTQNVTFTGLAPNTAHYVWYQHRDAADPANDSAVISGGSFTTDAATYTLTAEAGSFAWTGGDASLHATRRLDAESGVYALTGSDASFIRTVYGQAGAFVWTGFDVDLRVLAGHTLDAEAGSYAVTGSDASLSVHYRLNADAGAFAWNGVGAALTHNRVIDVDAGAFALTGSDAGLLVHHTLHADAGAFQWSGSDAGFLRGRVLDVDAGVYVWTGFDATLSKTGSYTLGAEAGSFTWTGHDAALLHGRVVHADAGSFALTGAGVAFLRNLLVAVEPGAYVWTGFDASLGVGTSLNPHPRSILTTPRASTRILTR